LWNCVAVARTAVGSDESGVAVGSTVGFDDSGVDITDTDVDSGVDSF